MVSIFFEDKVINFTAINPESRPGCVHLLSKEDFAITKVLQKLENNNTLWVVSGDYLALLESFRSLFEEVEAAGGVVRDPAGRVLMILRKSRWDLPKGHMEHRETPDICAVREVEEECGIHGLECGREIATTWHAYDYEGRWTLKRTHWFAMEYRGGEIPSPQAEEGIQDVQWFAPGGELEKVVERSYRTIKNVLKNI